MYITYNWPMIFSKRRQWLGIHVNPGTNLQLPRRYHMLIVTAVWNKQNILEIPVSFMCRRVIWGRGRLITWQAHCGARPCVSLPSGHRYGYILRMVGYRRIQSFRFIDCITILYIRNSTQSTCPRSSRRPVFEWVSLTASIWSHGLTSRATDVGVWRPPTHRLFKQKTTSVLNSHCERVFLFRINEFSISPSQQIFSGHYRPASKTPFEWRFVCWPMVAHFYLLTWEALADMLTGSFSLLETLPLHT